MSGFEDDFEDELEADDGAPEGPAECPCLVVDDDGSCGHFDPAPLEVATAIVCPGGAGVALVRVPRCLDCGHARTCHPEEV